MQSSSGALFRLRSHCRFYLHGSAICRISRRGDVIVGQILGSRVAECVIGLGVGVRLLISSMSRLGLVGVHVISIVPPVCILMVKGIEMLVLPFVEMCEIAPVIVLSFWLSGNVGVYDRLVGLIQRGVCRLCW